MQRESACFPSHRRMLKGAVIMGFFTRKRTPETTKELNGLDRLTKMAALNVSRRGFLRKIPALEIGVSLGLVSVRAIQVDGGVDVG